MCSPQVFEDRLRNSSSVYITSYCLFDKFIEGALLFTGIIQLLLLLASGSAIAEGPRDVLVSRNSATTKYRYRVALYV